MLLTLCACLVDEAVTLIATLAARSVISRVRLPIKMAFLFVVVNAVIRTAQVLGVRMVSPYYLWTDCVWIFSSVVWRPILPNGNDHFKSRIRYEITREAF